MVSWTWLVSCWTWVVSCAVRTPHRSGTAAKVSTATRLERQIVVLLIQRLRERVERFCCLASTHGTLGGCLHGNSSASRRQHDQLARDDLRDVARLLLAIFPSPVLDAPFDIHFVALLQVLLGDVGQSGTLIIP